MYIYDVYDTFSDLLFKCASSHCIRTGQALDGVRTQIFIVFDSRSREPQGS